MALKPLIFRPGKGSVPGGIFLNALKRYCASGLLFPPQALAIAKIPTAASITQPGRSPLIPIQGPNDAWSEVFSLTGKQGVVFQGIGKITTTGGNTNVTGVGTKFLSQLQIGDTIATDNGIATILTIPTNTLATTTGAMAAGTLEDYFFSTAVTDPIQRLIFCTIFDQAWRRMLMNRDVPAYHVFGSNTKPLFVKESVLLETDQTLMLQFLNYSTAGPASFAPSMEGRKWQYEAMKYPEPNKYIQGLMERKQFIQPYWLTLDTGFAAIGAASGATPTSTNLLTCTGDITLVLFNVYGQAFADSDGSDVSSSTTLELSDPKTQRAMQSAPQTMDMCCGTAENPFQLSTPWIVEPQTFIQARFRNVGSGFTGALTRRAYLTFHGVAIYTGSSWHGSTLTNKHLKKEADRMYKAMSTPQIRPASPRG